MNYGYMGRGRGATLISRMGREVDSDRSERERMRSECFRAAGRELRLELVEDLLLGFGEEDLVEGAREPVEIFD